MVAAYLALLAVIAVQRLAEMGIGRRNGRGVLARGGVETGRGHLAGMIALHVGFLASCALEVVLLDRRFVPALGAISLLSLIGAMALRTWSVWALGPLWNPRVIVLPGEPVVRRGPYRLVRHPNYAAVAIEMVAIPMIHTAWLTALVFSVLNVVFLRTRVRCEEAALEAHCPGSSELAALPRFAPNFCWGDSPAPPAGTVVRLPTHTGHR